MTGKSSALGDKDKIFSVATPARSIMLAQEEILSTRHDILKEDHESLKKDYASLEEMFKLVEEMNKELKSRLRNQTTEHEPRNLRLLKDLESERSQKEEYKKMVEEMDRRESESKATINDLRIKNEELLIVIEKEEEQQKKMVEKMKSEVKAEINDLRIQNEELLIAIEKEEEHHKKMVEEMERRESEVKAEINDLRIQNEELLIAIESEEEEQRKMENMYNELAEKYCKVDKECSRLKSLYDAENLTGQGGNDVAFDNEVIVVHPNVNNTVADAIVISDESDAEYDNPPRVCNIIPQLPVRIKQEEQCSDGANSSQVKQPSSKVKQPLSSSSSSSSSSEEPVYVVEVPGKRPRGDYSKFETSGCRGRKSQKM